MEKGKGRGLEGLGGQPVGGCDGPLSPAEDLAGHLTRAIESGDEKRAAQAAAILAQHHVALSIQLQEACFPPGPIR